MRPPTQGKPADSEKRQVLPELVRLEDVAQALGITERHVRRLVDERRIPFVKVGAFVRFEPAQVARWVEAQRVEPPAPPKPRGYRP